MHYLSGVHFCSLCSAIFGQNVAYHIFPRTVYYMFTGTDADGWIQVELKDKNRKDRRRKSQESWEGKPSTAGDPRRRLPKELVEKFNAAPWRASAKGTG